MYRKHGHNPSDDWQAAARDVATGDPDELAVVAEQLADLWPGRHGGWGTYPGYWAWWDDDWGGP